MVTYRAFDEVVDFLTSIPQPEQIWAYRPSSSAQNRLELLLDKKRDDLLSEEESHELEQFLLVEHLMRVAKRKAKRQLK